VKQAVDEFFGDRLQVATEATELTWEVTKP
jgi:hypothetical protein